MKTSRYTDGQILQSETGAPVSILCREHGI